MKENSGDNRISWVQLVVGSVAMAHYVARASLYGPEDWENAPETRFERVLDKILSRYDKNNDQIQL